MSERKYRIVKLAEVWAKSQFEYFSEITNEWRIVQNWNTREKLFNHFTNP